MNDVLDRLLGSKFRSSFHLNNKMKNYVRDKGVDVVRKHAYDLVLDRLSSDYPKNDGKQTPMRQVHPVFIAQHACACCCRGCLYKWHKIEKNRALTEQEVDNIVNLLMNWIENELHK